MKLEVGIPFTSYNLAAALQGDEGTFLCQQGGQTFLTVAAAGHSIMSGPTPIGRKVQEVVTANNGPEAWVITKISSEPIEFLLGNDRLTGTLRGRSNA